MDDTILETKGLTKEFRGFVAVNGSIAYQAGRDSCLDRAERRGQDHMLQSADEVPFPTSGTIKFNGVDITGERPRRSRGAA